MEIIAKLNKPDNDMVELYSHKGEWAMAMVHIDHFTSSFGLGLPTACELERLFEDNPDGIELELTLKRCTK